MKKRNLLGIVLLVGFLIAVVGNRIYEVHAANRGLDSGGTVWIGDTAGGLAGSTGTDTAQTPITVKTIVFEAATSTDTVLLMDGSNTETILSAAL